ncbi:hypothetical protein [Chromobacterium amazonense]|uniref:Uncharacterized protein n=1 Tax=Chromobacterium amazonense TaxID=1382803 RepID=A0ABU8V474_9NEIS|nr:hypothetical protein [Chromobacterium amazonense]MBM2883112.1 hypothetical protein [Chromobacterium amazonense]MDQ4540637.1 hypothetical protein [Chromobacterium amazonense]
MDAVRHLLPDPRQYHPQVSLTNRLIHHAQSVLDAPDAGERDMWRQALVGAIDEMLQRGEVLSISVALAMVPTQACYQIVWDALRQAVEETGGARALVFALPLVLVAGSREQAELPGAIADVEGLNALLRQHGVFAADGDAALSGVLLHPDSLVGLDALSLYRMARQGEAARDGLPAQAAPVTVKEEGVFLRYLIGVAVQREGEPCPVRLGGSVGAWGMPLMKFLGEQLQTDGVTLFPIARPPLPAMQALVAGNHARFEVALQVFASSQIRRLRELDKEPVAIVSAHENGELHFTVSAKGDERNWEGFVWPLASLDNVKLIEENFRELMSECRVRDVHVLPELQPESRDGVPLFFTADDL